jgi:NitT/TauT family transport system permease protein
VSVSSSDLKKTEGAERPDAPQLQAGTARIISLRPVYLPLWIRRGKRTSIWLKVSVFAVILSVWEIAAQLGWSDNLWISSPSEIWSALVVMTLSGELLTNVLASLQRVGFGFLIGAGVGLLLGLLLGWSKHLEDLFLPVVNALYPLPKLAILPLLVFWFGIGESSKIALIAFGTFFYVCLNTFTGTRIVEPALVKVAAMYKANTLQLWWYVLLPSALPMIMTGMKLGAGYALALVVAAEMIAAQNGLGRMVLLAGQFLQTDKLMAGVLVFGALGVGFYSLIDWMEAKLTPWRG